MDVMSGISKDISSILKFDKQSYESIAAYVEVTSMTVRRWHKKSFYPHRLFVLKVSEYLKSMK